MASTWGEPEITNASTMAGPAQINAAAEFAMRAGVRHFATQAAMISASGKEEGFLAVVEAIPGAIWRWDVSAATWLMTGVPRFYTTAERDAAFSAIPDKAEVYVSGDATVYKRIGSNWVKWNRPPAGYTPTWTNFTLGSSARSAWYQIVDGMVEGTINYTAGASASPSASLILISLPEPRHSAAGDFYPLGDVVFRDVSVPAMYEGVFLGASGDQSNGFIVSPKQSASYSAGDMGQWANFGNANTPGGWFFNGTGSNSDLFTIKFRYPIANSF